MIQRPSALSFVRPGDADIATATLWGEARGEPYAGKVAVAHVLINRWITTTGQWGKDDTLASVCLRDRQFSCWNRDDPNFYPITHVGDGDFDFCHCSQALREALTTPREHDPTGGARHYHTGSVHPKWAMGRKPSLRVGRHVFYAGID